MAESLKRLEWYSGTDAEYIKRNEVSIYWDWMGVRCKARLDSLLVEEGIVLDLKTTDTVDPELFTKKVVGLGYDFQAAYYAKAAEVAYGKPFKFIFAAVERKAPYTVDLFEVTPDMMAEGMYKCEKALKIYAECEKSGEWPNREPRILALDYPGWYNHVSSGRDRNPRRRTCSDGTRSHTRRLVSITPDAEKQIVYMARVSNPSNQNNMETAPRLIKYLIKHKHWSPFEMASMQVEINTTRAVAAQVLRHRSFSFQEFSQRYSSVDQLGTVGLPHLRSQDLKNKQASHDDLDPVKVDLMNKQIQQLYHNTFDYYEYLLSQGVAKECARSILPLGTPTRMYMSGSIRSGSTTSRSVQVSRHSSNTA